ncbi:MAG TPA: hypothetical protein PLF30_01490 [Candidatus Moranbacteria bacterium]|jgi:hypothetical protein|nr:hypothetical protein [Candidatus Moranbacteria bacterium]HQB59702.1 hypothetical protein [Candidatus Moranbacteria bacterium]
MHDHKFKKEKIGICNICNKKKQLTWDHVPPKGGTGTVSIVQETVLQKLAAGNEKRYSLSQNGIKYRTICKECNDKLGLEYDQELNKFVLGVKDIIEKIRSPLKFISYKVKPNLIIKSIFGHLLAAKVASENTKIDKSLKAYFSGESEKAESKLHVYYWLYPFENYVVLRDVVMPKVRGSLENFGMFSILKYFPIGYIVTDFEGYENLRELKYIKGDDNREEKIIIDLKFTHPDWPEIIDNGNILSGGKSVDSSVSAIKKK